MAIPASQIVAVNPRLIQPGGNDLVINGLLLTKNALLPVGATAFYSPEGVGAIFGLESDEYKAAVTYFNGYDNSFQKPRELLFGARIAEARAAWLRSAPYKGTLAELKTVTDGAMIVTIDGTAAAITGADFSGASTLSDVATAIQTALAEKVAGTTVTFSSIANTFTITSPTTGAASTITYADAPTSGTDLAALLGFSQNSGATVSPGADATTSAQDLQSILEFSANWATFSTMWEAEQAEALEFAQWATGKGVDFLYVPWSSTITGAQALMTAFEDATVSATSLIYGGSVGGFAYAAFIMGIAASIDWNRTGGVINFAFKSGAGLAPTVTVGETSAALDRAGINFYGSYATRNDSFNFLYPAAMCGDYRFIDSFINAVWLNNAMQLSVMNGLAVSGRVPYTEEGYTLIRSWLADPVERALNNGVIEPGLTLSESQKAQLIREAGLDITGELDTAGYYIQVLDPGPAVRVTRDSPLVSLWYTYGGSVNKIVLASTAIV